jgi:hypothetical protein
VIRTNLSTRPFYNERAVQVWLIALAVVVVAATVFNVTRVLRYSRSDTQLAGEATRDESKAADLRQQATRLRATVDMRQIDLASSEARQANDLIDRRTFSWTELFNRYETTAPDDVRIIAVKPRVEPGRGFMIVTSVVARTFEDVLQFMDRLQATGAFTALRPVEEHFDDQGLLLSTLESGYVQAKSKTTPTPTPAPAAAEGAAKP